VAEKRGKRIPDYDFRANAVGVHDPGRDHRPLETEDSLPITSADYIDSLTEGGFPYFPAARVSGRPYLPVQSFIESRKAANRKNQFAAEQFPTYANEQESSMI